MLRDTFSGGQRLEAIGRNLLWVHTQHRLHLDGQSWFPSLATLIDLIVSTVAMWLGGFCLYSSESRKQGRHPFKHDFSYAQIVVGREETPRSLWGFCWKGRPVSSRVQYHSQAEQSSSTLFIHPTEDNSLLPWDVITALPYVTSNKGVQTE